MFRYLCPAAISKTHSCPHFLMKPQKFLVFMAFLLHSIDACGLCCSAFAFS